MTTCTYEYLILRVRPILWVTLGTVLSILTGCSQYAVTVNEQPLYQPKELAAVVVADPSLQNCINQTIQDQGITQPEQLHTLVCTHGDIRSLEGLEQFTQLQQLVVNNNLLESVSVIADMKELQRLDLRGNPTLNCEQISVLTKQMLRKPLLALPEQCQ